MITFPPIAAHVDLPDRLMLENDVGPQDDDGDDDDDDAAFAASKES